MRFFAATIAVGACLALATATATASSNSATYPNECSPCPAAPHGLRPRLQAPSFSNVNAVFQDAFTKVSLADYEDQWLVLFFFPFAFTFVCPTEIISFSDRVGEFNALNTQVAAVSTDSHHTLRAWSRQDRDNGGLGEMNIPLLADISKRVSHDFGVLVEDENDPMYGAALRGLFIIDPTGKIRHMTINDDAVGRSVDETLRLLKAFQFADSHEGEVCPINWQPGDATIVADTDKSKEYFKAAWSDSKSSPASASASAPAAAPAPATLNFPSTSVHGEADMRSMCGKTAMAGLLSAKEGGNSAHHDRKITVKQIGGGITNKLYRCDLLEGDDDELVHTALIRIFGDNTEKFIDRVRESQVMNELAENGFGAAVIANFENGRVEGFLQGAALDTPDLWKEEIQLGLADHIGRMHSISLSGPPTAVIWATLDRWLQLTSSVTFSQPDKLELLKQINLPTLGREIKWLRKLVQRRTFPVTVCHNDLLAANVIAHGKELTLIDFEYSDWNYRGFDIANHFNEHAGFECDWQHKPNKAARTAFFKRYLAATGLAIQDMDAELDKLEFEVQVMSLASHAFWGIWGVLQEMYSSIPFDYLPYAQRRIARFAVEQEELKQLLEGEL